MAENSKIEWCHHTFNPWVGCRHISNGDLGACVNCYAFDWAKRAGRDVWGDSPRQRTSAENWRLPQRWNDRLTDAERARVFCASLADVFDNEVPQYWRDDLFAVIRSTPRLDWLLLTKRIGNAKSMLPADWYSGTGAPALYPNVWLGATVVTQEEANRDIPKLMDVPARIRFLSMEPLLGPVSLSWTDRGDGMLVSKMVPVDWVICGGESGPRARPMEGAWVYDLRRQCKEAGVPFFMKQGSKANWPDFKNFDSFPPSVRVREFPQ